MVYDVGVYACGYVRTVGVRGRESVRSVTWLQNRVVSEI